MLYQALKLARVPRPTRIIPCLTLLGIFHCPCGCAAIGSPSLCCAHLPLQRETIRAAPVRVLRSLQHAHAYTCGVNLPAIHSLGFALSFSVVAAILLIGIPLRKQVRLGWKITKPRPLPSYNAGIAGRSSAASPTVCASASSSFIGSAPLILAQFGVITPLELSQTPSS